MIFKNGDEYDGYWEDDHFSGEGSYKEIIVAENKDNAI